MGAFTVEQRCLNQGCEICSKGVRGYLITNVSLGCWSKNALGCWNNKVANSHLSSGPRNSRVLHSCLVPQCSHPPHWHCHQRRLANCEGMSMPYTNGQPSYSLRHSTCWASPQGSHTASSTPCHGAWVSVRLSAHLSIEWECTVSQFETTICIGVGAGKFLRVAKGFCPNFPKLARNVWGFIISGMTSNKQTSSCDSPHVGCNFSKSTPLVRLQPGNQSISNRRENVTYPAES